MKIFTANVYHKNGTKTTIDFKDDQMFLNGKETTIGEFNEKKFN